MNAPHACPKCGALVSADAPEGLCPACLMSGGFATGADTVKLTPSQKPGASEPEATPTPEELAPLFPQMEILELLGRGGMGAVYKARQKHLNRFVALKILPVDAGADPHFAERFQREAQALARLNHPNIVTVYEVGETNGLFYILMEFVDGASLRALMRSGGMKPEAALALIPAFCDALQYAHDEGVVHRDIKPENVLVDKKGRVKIADFGLAKLLGREAGDHTLTRTGMFLGTPRYMAPEQMDKPETVDHRADIYSLGVVFYEMLTGELPMGRFAPPSQKVQVDVRFDEIVLHALERDVTLRYQHVSEIKTDVQKVTDTPRPAAVGAQPASPQPTTSKPWSAWIWWTVLVLVTLPFFYLAQLNRAESLLGHGSRYHGVSINIILLPLALLALGAFAVIRLLELRRSRADAKPVEPFSQTWLGLIVAIFGVCVIAVGPFPHVEWLHEILTVRPTKVANTAGAPVELAGFSQTYLGHGYEFWHGRAIALVSVLVSAFLLVAPRRLPWNVACSVLLLLAGVAIPVLAMKFAYDRPGRTSLDMAYLKKDAKTDPNHLQFRDDFKRHKEAQAKEKDVAMEAIENRSGIYSNWAMIEYETAGGYGVCMFAGLALITIGVLKLRQTMISSPATFAGWNRVVGAWGSLLLLAPCLLSVLPAFDIFWLVNVAYIPRLEDDRSWIADRARVDSVPLAGVHFWQGKVIAAACIVAVLTVVATALLRWKRGHAIRAAALSLAGLVSIACSIHFVNGSSLGNATISWDDFHAVAQRGATAAASGETRQFLAEHPLFVEQIVGLEKSVQELAAKLAAPDPDEIPKVTVTKAADGKTITTTTYKVSNPIIKQEKQDQAKRLAQGGGVVKVFQGTSMSLQWPLFCGLGLLLLGIRDGYRWWKNSRECRTSGK